MNNARKMNIPINIWWDDINYKIIRIIKLIHLIGAIFFKRVNECISSRRANAQFSSAISEKKIDDRSISTNNFKLSRKKDRLSYK